MMNWIRVMGVAERMKKEMEREGGGGGGGGGGSNEMYGLCVSLARGIDYAVANNDTSSPPTTLPQLPALLFQLCHHHRHHHAHGHDDLFMQSAIMLLMLSVKTACNLGCFPPQHSHRLLLLADEIATSFSDPPLPNPPSIHHPFFLISTLISRFYPLLKLEHLLASLHVKPGFGAYLLDFHISKHTAHFPHQNIRLFVAHTDNTASSACITTPQQVNFLLNGNGVERRTTIAMDPGPQLPSNVTTMLKYGTNLLQAIGQFNGHYIIAIAFMSVKSLRSLDSSVIPDYVQSDVTRVDPDLDIIEGPSRISLNCPISYARIKTPVKGQSCKHLQCFDYNNYIDINSRRPSWRCPHCNQQVCYNDIRVDQTMLKILKEVGENVADVIISSDGWKAVLESDDKVDPTHVAATVDEKGSKQPESDLLDLTAEDDMMDTTSASNIVVEQKPETTALRNQNSVIGVATTVQMNNTNTNQNGAAEAHLDCWSGVFGSLLSNFRSAPMSPAINSGAGGHGSPGLVSVMPNQVAVSGSTRPQSSQLLRPGMSHEYGTPQQMPRHISRTPVAIQALPAQQRPQSNPGHTVPGPTPSVSQAAARLMLAPTVGAYNIPRTTHPRSQSPGTIRSSLPPTQVQTLNGGPQISGTNNLSAAQRFTSAANRLSQVVRPVQFQTQAPRAAVPHLVTNANIVRPPTTSGTNTVAANVGLEENWRPTGRMRGSLAGRDYAALRDSMIRPTQQGQSPRAAMPQADATSAPALPSIPPHLQEFLASQAAQAQMISPSSTSSRSGGQQ